MDSTRQPLPPADDDPEPPLWSPLDFLPPEELAEIIRRHSERKQTYLDSGGPRELGRTRVGAWLVLTEFLHYTPTPEADGPHLFRTMVCQATGDLLFRWHQVSDPGLPRTQWVYHTAEQARAGHQEAVAAALRAANRGRRWYQPRVCAVEDPTEASRPRPPRAEPVVDPEEEGGVETGNEQALELMRGMVGKVLEYDPDGRDCEAFEHLRTAGGCSHCGNRTDFVGKDPCGYARPSYGADDWVQRVRLTQRLTLLDDGRVARGRIEGGLPGASMRWFTQVMCGRCGAVVWDEYRDGGLIRGE